MNNEPPAWALEIITRLERIESKQAEPAPQSNAVLTRDESIAYVKAKNGRAFDAWRTKWHVKPCGYRRYSRCALDLALAREAGVARVPASIRKGRKSP